MSTYTSTFVSPRAEAKVGARSKAPAREGFWTRFFAPLIKARQRQAEESLRRRGYILPSELETPGWKVPGRDQDSLPFGR